MTREEMLDGLYEIKNWKCNGDVKMHEVVTEAIKALEQEPCEDAISRQAALDLCERFDGCVPYSVLSSYDMLPPVNPQEPKTGHWIYKQYGGYPEQGNYHCSECDNIDNRTPAYCPHCGCCMVKPQESEESE